MVGNLTCFVFIVEKELFYTDCQRWSYLFESFAVLSLMKIHKKPHVSVVSACFKIFFHNVLKSSEGL